MSTTLKRRSGPLLTKCSLVFIIPDFQKEQKKPSSKSKLKRSSSHRNLKKQKSLTFVLVPQCDLPVDFSPYLIKLTLFPSCELFPENNEIISCSRWFTKKQEYLIFYSVMKLFHIWRLKMQYEKLDSRTLTQVDDEVTPRWWFKCVKESDWCNRPAARLI